MMFYYAVLVAILSFMPLNVICMELPCYSLHDAVEQGNVEKIKVLLAEKVDINAQNPQNGQTPIHVAIRQQNLTVVELLCSYPTIDLNIRESSYQATPLHFAIFKKAPQSIIKVLLEHPQVDLTAREGFGKTPLDLACQEGQYDVIRLLLRYGATFNKYKQEMMEPIRLALKEHPILLAATIGKSQ